jgi:hypothetical protein
MRLTMTMVLLLCLTTGADAGSVPAHHTISSADRERHDSALSMHHERTQAALDSANGIPRPPVMFDTSHWSHETIEHLWLRGLDSYSLTGHLPDTNLWKYVEWREEIDPSRFYHYHPFFEGIFTPAPTVGLLPQGPFWSNLERHYDQNPTRFDLNRPALATAMERNVYSAADPINADPISGDPKNVDPKNVDPMNTVREPSTRDLLLVAGPCLLVIVLHEALRRRKQVVGVPLARNVYS